MSDLEPPFRLLTPDGRWAIEVTEDESGAFVSRVILDGTIETAKLVTPHSRYLLEWTSRQMKEAMRRTGGGQNAVDAGDAGKVH
jgi:hypothetical protein